MPGVAACRGVREPEQEAGVDFDRGRFKLTVQNVTVAGRSSHQQNTNNGHCKDYWYSGCLIPWPFYDS